MFNWIAHSQALHLWPFTTRAYRWYFTWGANVSQWIHIMMDSLFITLQKKIVFKMKNYRENVLWEYLLEITCSSQRGVSLCVIVVYKEYLVDSFSFIVQTPTSETLLRGGRWLNQSTGLQDHSVCVHVYTVSAELEICSQCFSNKTLPYGCSTPTIH